MTDKRQSSVYREPKSNNPETKPVIIGLQNVSAIIGRVVISQLGRRVTTATLIVRNQSPDCRPKYHRHCRPCALRSTIRVTGAALRMRKQREARGTRKLELCAASGASGSSC